MSSISFNATPFEPAFRLPPTPRPPAITVRPDDVPIVVAPRRLPPRRQQSIPVLELLFAAGTLAILAIFALRLVERVQPVVVVDRPDQPRVTLAPVDPIAPAHGKGQYGTPGQSGQSPVTVSREAEAPPVGPSSEARKSVEELIASGLKACREGWFDAADDLGTEATRLAPHDPRGHGIRVLTAYLRQYPDLADEAIDRMNGAVEVDLGRRYGIGAFVERSGDEVVFMAKGRHERFTIREFNSLDGVRFRVTRQFLENGRQPANDLILGAVHYVKQLDETGAYRPDAAGVKQAVSRRWETAAQSFDQQVASHAQALLSLLDDSGRQVANALQR